MKNKSPLRRLQLDRQLQSLSLLRQIKRPKTGWIREIREALGMNSVDLASRLGVIQQRISRLEKDELEEKLTLATLKKTAAALNCELVYFLVPKESLENSVKDAALDFAKNIVAQTEHTMNLEAQPTSIEAQRQVVERLASEMILTNDHRIWRKR